MKPFLFLIVAMLGVFFPELVQGAPEVFRQASDGESLSIISATEVEYYQAGRYGTGHYERKGDTLRCVFDTDFYFYRGSITDDSWDTGSKEFTFKKSEEGWQSPDGILLLSEEYYDKAQNPFPTVGDMRGILLRMAKRLVEAQRAAPDDKIKAIIQGNHLGNTDALEHLDNSLSRSVVIHIATSLYQASSASDQLATTIMKEFDITVGPPPKPPPMDRTKRHSYMVEKVNFTCQR